MKVRDIQTITPFRFYSQAEINEKLSHFPKDAEIIGITQSNIGDNEITFAYDIWLAIRKGKDKEEEEIILPDVGGII
jgi:hypothetical protein